MSSYGEGALAKLSAAHQVLGAVVTSSSKETTLVQQLQLIKHSFKLTIILCHSPSPVHFYMAQVG